MQDPTNTQQSAADLISLRSDSAWKEWRGSSLSWRAQVISQLADALEAERDSLAATAAEETHLDRVRLSDEVVRAATNARLVADSLPKVFADATVLDPADPGRVLGVHTGMERRQLAVGPVLNFAASNFPFSFSVFGGDTVAALAAGCSVICKVHPGHPATSHATARIIHDELRALGLPEDLLQLAEGDDLGRELLTHPLVRAASFTGSIRVGTELFRIAANRPVPIPFYGELGSINPVFVLPSAAQDTARLAAEIVGFTTWSGGQVCTKPGLVFVPDNVEFDDFVARAASAVAPQQLLHPGVAAGFAHRRAANSAVDGVVEIASPHPGSAADPDNWASPGYATISFEKYLASASELNEEVFGPYSLIVKYNPQHDLARLPDAIAQLPGSLTAAIHSVVGSASPQELGVREALSSELPYHVGRLIFNQWTTEMSVTPAQHHGGPWPATTIDNASSTAIGPAGVLRFVRAVALQNHEM